MNKLYISSGTAKCMRGGEEGGERGGMRESREVCVGVSGRECVPEQRAVHGQAPSSRQHDLT